MKRENTFWSYKANCETLHPIYYISKHIPGVPNKTLLARLLASPSPQAFFSGTPSMLPKERWFLQSFQELSDWYAQNSIQLEKLRETNRAAMMNSDKTFVAQIEPIQPGTEWDRYLDIYINKVAVCLSRTFSFTIVIITQVLV